MEIIIGWTKMEMLTQYFDANGVLQTEIAPDEGENDGQYNAGGNGVYDQYDPSTCIFYVGMKNLQI